MAYKSNDRINDQYWVQNCFVGGMGMVYIAIDEVTKRKLAIKTIADSWIDQEDAILRFEREARCWINLGYHENIVRAISFHRADVPLLLLEFIDGPTLGQLLKSEPAGLDYGEVLRLSIQLCRGLAFAHCCPMPNGSVGVIHRDIKPGNILLTKQGVPKLTDFGLVRSQNDTELGTGVLGTPFYMSPEQSVNSRKVTMKADVYSLGVVLYEMMTGIRPHRGHSIVKFRPDADPDLIQLVESCLEHSAATRPSSEVLLDQLLGLEDRFESPVIPCPNCAYRPRKQHLYCPICGIDRESAMSGQWRCSCGKPNDDQFAFCLGCGKQRLNLESCSICGESNPHEFSFCISCGSKLKV